MSLFDRYALWYDLLYADKAYDAEAAFVASLLAKHGVSQGDLLELGCGTGRHALHFADSFAVQGIDLSPEMVRSAEARASGAARPPRFRQGDIRDVRVDRTFDAVVSLFHTYSYLWRETDLAAGFATAAAHVRPGGLFLFDAWYGPAVLTTPPEPRAREVATDEIELYRFSRPTMLYDANAVDVAFTLFAREPSGASEVVRETHRMRYLFRPEIEGHLDRAGFDLVDACEWMDADRALDNQTWQAVFVARRRAGQGA